MGTPAGWTWEATATIIQAIATVVALTGVAVTFILALRAERRERERAREEAERAEIARADARAIADQERDRSQAAADRAERAASLSIDTLARIAQAIEEMASTRVTNSITTARIAVPKVRWSLTASGNKGYLLSNFGSATAHHVHIDADPTLRLIEVPVDVDVRPYEAVKFFAFRSLATRDSTITVTWVDSDDPDAERQEWRYPLP